MLFRQLFEPKSCTYTYIIAARPGGEALIIDPVLEQVDQYLQLFAELDLRLVKTLDTHVHADHITGMGRLRDETHCITVMGERSEVDCVSMRVREGEMIDVDGISLKTLYTPGHTDDSYSFVCDDRVFTGDTLLIRGTGRTDFQNGDARAQYDSIFNKLLKLPDSTMVYPAHDYKGWMVSTIDEERQFNPRLQVDSMQAYVDIMDNLNLPNPKQMDVAVPANLAVGLSMDLGPEESISVGRAAELVADKTTIFVDLREVSERIRDGFVAGAIHLPYQELDARLDPSHQDYAEELFSGRPVILYCAHGERSALALTRLKSLGLRNISHLVGGISAWKEAGHPLHDDAT